MSADDLMAWMVHMGGGKRRLSDPRAAALLGCGRNTVLGWRTGRSPIPRYIALACAALAFGLPAWRSPGGPGAS